MQGENVPRKETNEKEEERKEYLARMTQRYLGFQSRAPGRSFPFPVVPAPTTVLWLLIGPCGGTGPTASHYPMLIHRLWLSLPRGED